MEVQVGDFCHGASLVERIAKLAHAVDMGRFMFLSASLALKLRHQAVRLLGCWAPGVGHQVVRLLGAMSGSGHPGTSATYVQLPHPAVNTYVRCIMASGYANTFATEHDLTLFEVVPSTGFLLPVGSVCRVRQLGLDPRSGMPLLSLQAWDVPCYGADHSVLIMRSMMWMGTVMCLWIPRPFADALPVCRLVWMGLGAEQRSDQFGAEQRSESPRMHDAE